MGAMSAARPRAFPVSFVTSALTAAVVALAVSSRHRRPIPRANGTSHRPDPECGHGCVAAGVPGRGTAPPWASSLWGDEDRARAAWAAEILAPQDVHDLRCAAESVVRDTAGHLHAVLDELRDREVALQSASADGDQFRLVFEDGTVLSGHDDRAAAASRWMEETGWGFTLVDVHGGDNRDAVWDLFFDDGNSVTVQLTVDRLRLVARQRPYDQDLDRP
jgi:hypothetical protein